MSQSCGHDLPCNCRRDASDVINKIKDQVERCNQKNMSLEETMAYLQDTHQIDPYITKTIWEQLEKENPVFFKAYHWRCEKWRQKKICNSLLAEQVALMHDHVHLDLTNPPPEIVNILCQDLELRTRLLQNLANTPTDRSEVSPQSLSLSETNGPIGYGTQSMTQNQLDLLRQQLRQVWEELERDNPELFRGYNLKLNQLGTSSDQQPQHHNQLSTPHDFAYSQNPTVAQAATTAQDPRNLTVAQASTTAQDPSTSQIRDHIRDNSQRDLQTQQVGGSNNRIHFTELFNRLQNRESSNNKLLNGGSNNGLQNGESSKRILNGGSNNKLQIGGSTNGLLNGERINGIQIGGRTNGLLNGGSNNGLQNGGNVCGTKTRQQNGERITRIYYRRHINGQQVWENINRILNGGRINGLQGVIPQQNHQIQEQDIITIQDQGEPSYSTSDSETSNNSDNVTRD